MAVSGYWVCYWLGETCYVAIQKYCYAFWYLGSSWSGAWSAAVIKLPATVINVVVTILIVAIAYFPLRAAIQRVTKGLIN